MICITIMSNSDHRAITAVILTHNSERLLLQCLQSLQFCSAIIVVDAGSTDATSIIAKQCGATVVYREWDSYQGQYSFALSQVQTPWTLVFDSDEVCTQELQNSIIQEINNTNPEHTVFLLRRCTWYLNRFLLHGKWYPEYIARCFKTGQVRIEINNGGHIEFSPQNTAKKLEGDILHYTYSGYFDQLTKLNKYAENGAKTLRERGQKGGIVRALVHSIGRFFVQYIIKLGFLDGRAGFILSVHESFYVFFKYIRVMEDTWGIPYTYAKGDTTLPLHNVKD